jgi:hypothetical protein
MFNGKLATLLVEDGIEGNLQCLPDRLNSEVASVIVTKMIKLLE